MVFSCVFVYHLTAWGVEWGGQVMNIQRFVQFFKLSMEIELDLLHMLALIE